MKSEKVRHCTGLHLHVMHDLQEIVPALDVPDQTRPNLGID